MDLHLYEPISDGRAALRGHGREANVGDVAVYVDAVRSYPNAGRRFTEYCHLLADTRDELHEFADRLGIPQRFFQDHPWRWHHDLPAHARQRAIELGARELTMHEVGALLRARKANAGIA